MFCIASVFVKRLFLVFPRNLILLIELYATWHCYYIITSIKISIVPHLAQNKCGENDLHSIPTRATLVYLVNLNFE